MAEKSLRLSQNAPGRFYVDSTCIDCDMCRGTAPEVFQRDDDVGQTVVFRQPATADEAARARQALEECPSDSIGNDGTSVENPQPTT